MNETATRFRSRLRALLNLLVSRRRGASGLRLLALALVAAGCSPRAESRPSLEIPLVVHGFVSYGHEVRSFTPCDGGEALWVVDSTQLLWTLFQDLAGPLPASPKVYAVLEGREGPVLSDGFGADYSGTFFLDRVLHLAAEGDRCRDDLQGLRYWAGGNEPFWAVSATSRVFRLHRLGSEPTVWEGVREEVVGETVSVVPGGGAGDIRLVLRTQACRDSMSGSHFGFSARLLLEGDTLFGCALRGGAAGGS
jgi:uncharacterized membrane protein